MVRATGSALSRWEKGGRDEWSSLDAAGLASALVESDLALVLDPEIGPEGPADNLRLGASFLIRPLFERGRLVLVEVAHLPDEAAAGEGLPGSLRFRLSGRHGESIAERGAYSSATLDIKRS